MGMEGQVLFGKYRILKEIARGGMGMVYLALDMPLDRQVAIKVLHAQFSGDSSFVQRFLREARAMARLDHQNIIRIYAVEEDKGSHYIVMEFFPGRDLKQLVRERGQLPIHEIIRIGMEVADGLANAHNQRIVHRDIKPANIMIDDRGRVKIADFGIAAALEEASITATGTVMGTPLFMSPEQAKFGSIDARSDLYSLGMVLYDLVAGKTPFHGMPAQTILGKLAYETGELTLTFPEGTPSALQNVLKTLLKKNPDDRFQNAKELYTILRSCCVEDSLSPVGEEETIVLTENPTEIIEEDTSKAHKYQEGGVNFEETVSVHRITQDSEFEHSSKITDAFGSPLKSQRKNFSYTLMVFGVGACGLLLGGLMYFLEEKAPSNRTNSQVPPIWETIKNDEKPNGPQNKEEPSNPLISGGTQNDKNQQEKEMLQAKSRLYDLNKEFDEEAQRRTDRIKILNARMQRMLTQVASLAKKPKTKNKGDVIGNFQAELELIEKDIKSFQANQENTKMYLEKKGTPLVAQLMVLIGESSKLAKDLKVEGLLKQYAQNKESFENTHQNIFKPSLDLLAKVESELAKTSMTWKRQKEAEEKNRQKLDQKAHQLLLASNQEIEAEWRRYQAATGKILKKVKVSVGDGEMLKVKAREPETKSRLQLLRQNLKRWEKEFEEEQILHQTKNIPILERANDALAEVGALPANIPPGAQEKIVKDAKTHLLSRLEEYQIHGEQQATEMRSLLGQATSVFNGVETLIMTDSSRQPRILVEALLHEIVAVENELKGDQRSRQLIFDGLRKQIEQAREDIKFLMEISEVAGAIIYSNELRQKVHALEDQMKREVGQLKMEREELKTRTEELTSNVAVAKSEAQKEMEELHVVEFLGKLKAAQREIAVGQDESIQQLEMFFQSVHKTLEETVVVLQAKKKKNLLVGNLIGQLDETKKRYLAEYEHFKKLGQGISEKIQGKVSEAKKISSSTSLVRQDEEINNLRQDIQAIAREMTGLNEAHHQVKERLHQIAIVLIEEVNQAIQKEGDDQIKRELVIRLEEMDAQRGKFESSGQIQMEIQGEELAEVENLLKKTEIAALGERDEGSDSHGQFVPVEEGRPKEQLVPQQPGLGLESILTNFRLAYEKKDLPALRQLSSMKETRERFLKTLFARHSNIQIMTKVESVNQNQATAKILIVKLEDLKGNSVKPNRIVKETTVTIPKEGDTWGKIQW